MSPEAQSPRQNPVVGFCCLDFFLKYLFIFHCARSLLLHTGFPSFGGQSLLSSCGGRVSHRSGFSCCSTQALRAQAQQLWHTGLAAQQQCGIFLNQGSNLCPLHWQADSSPLGHQRSPSTLLFNTPTLSTLSLWEGWEKRSREERTGFIQNKQTKPKTLGFKVNKKEVNVSKTPPLVTFWWLD